MTLRWEKACISKTSELSSEGHTEALLTQVGLQQLLSNASRLRESLQHEG